MESDEGADVALETVMARLKNLGAGKAPTAELSSYAEVLLKLHAGLSLETPSEDQEEQVS